MDGQAPRLRAERDVDGVTAEVRGERLTVGQMLRETVTDGFVARHGRAGVRERNADGMSEDTLHLTMGPASTAAPSSTCSTCAPTPSGLRTTVPSASPTRLSTSR